MDGLMDFNEGEMSLAWLFLLIGGGVCVCVQQEE